MNAQKIRADHLERLAIVYIRQSSMQQVLRNQESTRMQYDLVEVARRLGWTQDRILTLDDDLGMSGASAEGRLGFQRVLSEVALDHVGLVVGLEMSRLARSNKDWHQLLELCARFGTLIADLDGLYDPSQYNDRLLLGLKGTMSEAELHILRQRLMQGKLQKAKRGELGKPVPSGYLRKPSGEVVLDPDEEVRDVIRYIFDRFDEIGTVHGLLRDLVKNDIRIGTRLRTGDRVGELEWRRPQRGLLLDILRNPIYTGAYVYGRRQIDPRKKKPGQRASGRTSLVTADRWLACLKDHLPSYISWERYERNQTRLAANQNSFDTPGSPKRGSALLQGLLVCGRCQYRMSVQYTVQGNKSHARYACTQEQAHYAGPRCQSLSARTVDAAISRLVLEAVEPAALEISLSASREIERERKKLDELWSKKLQRAKYEAERASRQYQAVEPENRLVARTLESAWEQKLAAERQLQDDHRRFQVEQPRTLSIAEVEMLRKLSSSLPDIWAAPSTSNEDRKAVLRLLIERVKLLVHGDTEKVTITVYWVGGHETTREITRPVGKLGQLSNGIELLDRIKSMRTDGYTASQIADRLNAEGWKTPMQGAPFNERLVRAMVNRNGITSTARGSRRPPNDDPNEWWLSDLAERLSMSRITLYGWARRGIIRARKLRKPSVGGSWVIWADSTELARLQKLRTLDSSSDPDHLPSRSARQGESNRQAIRDVAAEPRERKSQDKKSGRTKRTTASTRTNASKLPRNKKTRRSKA